MIKIDDAHQLPIVRDVLIEIENRIDDLEPTDLEDKTTEMLGDVVAVDTDSTDIMNDQMRNELNVLELDEKSAPPDVKEVTLEISPKPSATMVIETISNDKTDAIEDQTKPDEDQNSNELKNDQLKMVSESNETVLIVKSDDSGNIEMHQEPSKSTEDVDRIIVTKDIDIVQPTNDTVAVKGSIEFEKMDEAQNDNVKTDTKIVESLEPTTPTVATAAAAAAGVLGTIIVTESVTKSIKESETHHNEQTKTMAMSETVVEHARITDDIVDSKLNANDLPSSDFSDTETTTDKAEKMYTESGVDETSRDEYERDEVSEIENFDLSSCGEDSLEAMYYMIRKNEIIMDRHHKEDSSSKSIHNEEERIGVTFPEKATDDLEQAVREVSGKKKVKICSIGSMDSSSMDDVVLKKMSSDSDELQVHVIPNSEIESSDIDGGSASEPKKRSIHTVKEQSTVNESTTDDEYIRSNLVSMQKSSDDFDEAAAVAAAATVAALSFQSDSQSDDQQHHNETDTFDEHLEDMMPGNIERKILASSTDDSDMSTGGGGGGRLTKDNFNVSTAFEHMIRTDSNTEESDTTIESAATKIQAGARGFLQRRRNRRSDGSTGTSMSMEKVSSIGNAAIDKSLDSLFESKHELHEETSSTVYSESFEESSERTHSRQMQNDQTIDSVDSEKILGITEVKVEQRKDNDDDDGENTIGNDDSGKEKVPDINIQGISEESATASKRRLMLHRGDAMQRNSSAEQQPQQNDKEGKTSTDDSNVAAQNARANIKTVSTTKKCKFKDTHFALFSTFNMIDCLCTFVLFQLPNRLAGQ